jgi:glycine/D-amino acid oxidase-like deaminating enzyme
VQAAQKRGATIHARERVEGWTADESGVRVVTDRGTYTAETLVATVGAWTGELCPSLEELRREPTRDDEAVLRRFADAYAPTGAGPTMRLVDRLYTNTPDRDFLLDVHPDHDSVVVAGFSGHGFKFVPVVGVILADLAARGATEHPIDR